MNVIVGNKLKILRRDKKMSQEEVADYLRISQSAYARMENGESHSWANHIQNLCKVFVINPEELLKIDDAVISQAHQNSISDPDNAPLPDEIIAHYEEKIKELKNEIKILKKERKV